MYIVLIVNKYRSWNPTARCRDKITEGKNRYILVLSMWLIQTDHLKYLSKNFYNQYDIVSL